MYIEFPVKIHEKLVTVIADGVEMGVSGLEIGVGRHFSLEVLASFKCCTMSIYYLCTMSIYYLFEKSKLN